MTLTTEKFERLAHKVEQFVEATGGDPSLEVQKKSSRDRWYSTVCNQAVFDYVVPRLLEQGPCWAPGFGHRYFLEEGYFWTGNRYKTHTELREDKTGGKTFDADKVTITKFAGNKIYEKAGWRYDPVAMMFVDRPKNHPILRWSRWRRVFELDNHGRCDCGAVSEELYYAGFDVSFMRALQEIHDDLSLNPKTEWADEFDHLSSRYGLDPSGVRGDWLKLVNNQFWDYHQPDTYEAIKIEYQRRRYNKVA